MLKFSKFCSESFTTLRINVVLLKCRKFFFGREIAEIVHYFIIIIII